MSSNHEVISAGPPTGSPSYRGIYVCGMSRSGTTLLSTILDSHPDVAMGYEMLPTGLGSLADAATSLRSSILAAGDEARGCAECLQGMGLAAIARLVRQCDRAEVSPSGVLECLESFAGDTRAPDSIELRAAISSWIVGRKAAQRGCRHAGFKINAPSVDAFLPHVPAGRFIFITRDPRDVLASHIAAEFDRTAAQVATAWSGYVARFLAFQSQHPEIAFVVRYEDLVTEPDRRLAELCTMADIPFDTAMRAFFESEASVHTAGHRNSSELEQDFFTTSIGRWRRDVDESDRRLVETVCQTGMTSLGYVDGVTSGTGTEAPRRSWLSFLRR